jgi:hypothetical protein
MRDLTGCNCRVRLNDLHPSWSRRRHQPGHGAADAVDEEHVGGGEVFAVVEVEQAVDVGAVDLGEQGKDLGCGPAPVGVGARKLIGTGEGGSCGNSG